MHHGSWRATLIPREGLPRVGVGAGCHFGGYKALFFWGIQRSAKVVFFLDPIFFGYIFLDTEAFFGLQKFFVDANPKTSQKLKNTEKTKNAEEKEKKSESFSYVFYFLFFLFEQYFGLIFFLLSFSVLGERKSFFFMFLFCFFFC